jgi:hypothetical protein
LALLALVSAQRSVRADLVINLDQVLTGTTPDGSAPWLTATFKQIATNEVQLTLTSHFTGSDFLQGATGNNYGVAFNLDPSP